MARHCWLPSDTSAQERPPWCTGTCNLLTLNSGVWLWVVYTDRQKKPDTYFGGYKSVKQVHNGNLVYTTFKTNHFSTISCKNLFF